MKKKKIKYFISTIFETFDKPLKIEEENIKEIKYFQTLDSLYNIIYGNETTNTEKLNEFLKKLKNLFNKNDIKFLIKKNEYNEIYINFPSDKKNIKKVIDILNQYF